LRAAHPQPAGGQDLFDRVHPASLEQPSTKSGGTPDLTGGTPVPPILNTRVKRNIDLRPECGDDVQVDKTKNEIL
jgi:hypothetical protein